MKSKLFLSSLFFFKLFTYLKLIFANVTYLKLIFVNFLFLNLISLNLALFSSAYIFFHSSPLKAETLESYIQEANSKKLYEKKQWLDLLHYRPNAIGLIRSQVKGSEFFLSKDGYKNSQSELIATLNGFFSPKDIKTSTNDQHPLCLFPARKRWLQKELQIPSEKFPQIHCKFYSIYLKKLSPESVSVVFSSYFANSPGSAFGHTFFRFNRQKQSHQERNELLDAGISYAADVTTENPLIYALFGIVGGFQGTFTNVPYYYKVREYNDFESRSLWSYDLNLNPEELAMLVDHLWEVGGTYFDYYFFTQNCGFHMLTVLEVAAPRYHFIDKISIYVIPIDIIKVLYQNPGLVSKVSFRPSAKEKFNQKFKLLSEKEQKKFRAWEKSKDKNLDTESLKEKLTLTDIILDFYDFKYPKLIQEVKTKEFQDRSKILLMRAQIPESSPIIETKLPEEERPETGHSSSRLGYHLGHLKHQEESPLSFGELQIRLAFHDIMDPPKAYPESSTIEFANIRLRHFFDNKKSQLEEFTFFNIKSQFPLEEFIKEKSWGMTLLTKRIYDERCFSCMAGGIEGLVGLTYRPFDRRFFISPFLYFSLLRSDEFNDKKNQLSLGPKLECFYAINDQSSFRFDLIAFSNLENLKKVATEKTFEFRHNISSQWSMGFKYINQTETEIYSLSLFQFF